MSERPLEGLRAILAVPTYGPVDSLCSKDVRLGMMVAARLGLEWVGDASPDRLGFSAARNSVTQAIYDEHEKPIADGIMWVDSDMRSKPSDMANLLRSAVEYKEGFVTGVYHQRAVDLLPVLYEYRPKTKTFHQVSDYPLNAFAQMGGCGFGFVWTSFEVIDAIRNHKDFDDKKGWFPDERDSGGFGEDLSFCYQAIQAGKQLYVNSSILLGHTGDPKVITREDYVKLVEERRNIVNVESEETV